VPVVVAAVDRDEAERRGSRIDIGSPRVFAPVGR
jgi:hypothetical protein